MENNLEIIIRRDGKEDLSLDRNYVEGKCQWREQYDRVASWMLDKDRKV